MKLNLSQADLNAAVAAHITSQLGFPSGTQVDTKFSLTGKARDIVSAEVEVYLPGQAKPEAAAAEATSADASAPVTDGGVFGG